MVKCAECGFLTLRDKANGFLVEVDEDYRVSGKVPNIVADEYYHNWPICFTMAWNLFPEVEQAAQQQHQENSNDWGKYVLGVITRDRICPPESHRLGFAEYQQGFTPKEHRGMLDRQWLLDREERQDKEIREWQRSQEDKSDKRHKEQLGTLKGIHKREMLIVGIGVTIAIAIVSFIGAAIEAGWFPRWFGLAD